MLFNLVLGLAFLFILSFLLINPVTPVTKPSAEREGYFVIVAKWNDGVNADVDLWVLAPDGEASGFTSRDTNTMSLMRDDLGTGNDVIINEDGTASINPLNREEVSIRIPQIGTYTVNLHYYRVDRDHPDVDVVVEVKNVKSGAVIAERKMKLTTVGEEQTPFSFQVNRSKSVTGVQLPDTPELWVMKRSGQHGNAP